MKHALIITLYFVAIMAAHGQSVDVVSCPMISVFGPAGIVLPGEPIKFGSKVTGPPPLLGKVTYKWIVDKGVIPNGKDSPEISVVLRDTDEPRVTATLEVSGLPRGCPKVASETYGVAVDRFDPELIGEDDTGPSKIDKAQLDKFFHHLRRNPDAMAYVIEYFPKGTSAHVISRKDRLTRDYLVKLKRLEPDRLVILPGEGARFHTKYYVVHPGSRPPIP